MAITAQERDEIFSLVIGMWHAAPGSDDLSGLVAQFESGATLLDLANTLAEGDYYKEIYPPELSNSEWADEFLHFVLGDEVSDTDRQTRINQVTESLNSGTSRPEMITTEMEFFFHHMDQDIWFNAAEAVRNKVVVASHYAVTLDLQADNLDDLQEVIEDVTSDPDSIDAAIDNIPNIGKYELWVYPFTSVLEFDGGTVQMTFDLRLDGPASQDVTVDYATNTAGSATAGIDFESVSGQVIFLEGQSSATVSVTVVSDSFFESDETVEVQFSGELVRPATAIGTINDDDASILPSLDGSNGFRLDGSSFDQTGYSVSGAGDINGDGYDDLIIGAPFAGSGYLVFGKDDGYDAAVDLTSLDGSNGFRLHGSSFDQAGYSVSGAGDVNGDGYDDLIIGAPWANNNGSNSGSSFVVFGKADGYSASFSLASLDGSNGFRLDGVGSSNQAGSSVSSAGDINGDGYDDLAIGAGDTFGRGLSYVLLGKAGGHTATINLADLDGSNGFAMSSPNVVGSSEIAVSGAGDVNGDGYDDLIVGRPWLNNGDGSSYVVFGKPDGFAATVDLTSLDGNNGFRLDGMPSFLPTQAGYSVGGAGDFNGDGYDDVIIGTLASSSYVVFGKPGGYSATIDLANLDGDSGLRLEGQHGYSVSGAGDVNGDGYDDLIIGSPNTDPGGAYGGYNTGSSYLVFGKADWYDTVVDLASLDGNSGLLIIGASGDDSGFSVSGAGDVNGDGNDDLIIGAPGRGDSYVIFDTTNESVDTLVEGGPGNDLLVGGSGNDVLRGFGGRDTLEGLAGNDFLEGDDPIYGDGDIDLAVYHNDLSDFTVTSTGGQIIVSGPPSEGQDTLLWVERLQFADLSLAFDLDGNAGTIVKLLGVVLGKDDWYHREYIGIGLDLIDNSTISFEALMDLAFSVIIGPSPSNTDVVSLIYNNLIGQAPSQEELNTLVADLLDNGAYTQGGLGVLAAEHELNLMNIDLVGLAETGVEYFAVV